MRSRLAAVVCGGIFIAGCGSNDASNPTPSSGDRGTFVVCSGAANGASYAIVETPGPNCRPLVVGRDYADGRVIIRLVAGTKDAELTPALTAYSATVISSQPSLNGRVLAVPDGSVPRAVVGLARYSFIALAAPDLIAHVADNT